MFNNFRSKAFKVDGQTTMMYAEPNGKGVYRLCHVTGEQLYCETVLGVWKNIVTGTLVGYKSYTPAAAKQAMRDFNTSMAAKGAKPALRLQALLTPVVN